MKTGKLPENALKRSVLRQIHTGSETVRNGAGIGKDCAILAFGTGAEIAVCVQEGMVEVQGEAFMALAASEPAVTMGALIQKCANNLAAGGARPLAAMVTLLLPEGAGEQDVKALMAQAADKCKELNMEILGGQTRITKGAAAVLGTVTGFGKMYERVSAGDAPGTGVSEKPDSEKPDSEKTDSERLDLKEPDSEEPDSERLDLKKPDLKERFEEHPREHPQEKDVSLRRAPFPGQDVVLSKWIGLEGTALLAKRCRPRLLERYPAYLVEEAEGFGRYLSIVPEAEAAAGFGAGVMHDASEGGIFGALWELAEGAGVGLSIDMRKLSLRQETVEVCECCGVNPYELLAGGCLIMTAQDGPGLVSALERQGIPAAVVGKVTKGNERILINGDEIRYMDRPKRDAVYGLFENQSCTE